MDLSKEVFHTITKHHLIQRGDTVIVGVSGGADSVCLLFILNGLKHQFGAQLHVAHFNHRLRPTANKDEVFVKDLANQLNLPITVGRRQESLKRKLVSEDQARQWRLEFFLKTAKKTKASTVVLAHHQDDLAETVLMRLLRGTGLFGLKGILVESQMNKIRLIRPFLSISKIQIEQYLKEHHVSFCQDETNSQTYYLRNKIRLKLLPYLVKEYNPNISSVLIDLACTAGEDYDYLLQQARAIFNKTAKISKSKVELDLRYFLKQHESMQRMLLRLSYEHLRSNLNQLGFSHIQEAQEMLLTGPQSTIVHWPKSVRISRSKSRIIFITISRAKA